MATRTDRITELDDAAHLRDTDRQFANMRIAPAYGTDAWYDEAAGIYTELKGSAEACRDSKRFLLRDHLAKLAAEEARLQEELVKLDEPEFVYEDAVVDFAQRFIDWINTKGETK